MIKEYIDYYFGHDQALSYNHTPSAAARSAYFFVQSAGYFKCNEQYFTRRQGYRSFLLLYTTNGKGCVIYREKQYELTKGSALLINCYDYHEYFCSKGSQWEIKWLHFYGTGSEGYFNNIYQNHGPVINMSNNGQICLLLDSIMELMSKSDIHFEIKASSIIVQLLTEILLTASTPTMESIKKNTDVYIQASLELVENNYASEILLEDMASAACCSIYHFSRVFKKVTGFSPYEYLIKFRITKAKNLLKTTDKSVDEISRSVGFDDPSNFIKTFKRLEELTPLKYRKYWHSQE